MNEAKKILVFLDIKQTIKENIFYVVQCSGGKLGILLEGPHNHVIFLQAK